MAVGVPSTSKAVTSTERIVLSTCTSRPRIQALRQNHLLQRLADFVLASGLGDAEDVVVITFGHGISMLSSLQFALYGSRIDLSIWRVDGKRSREVAWEDS